MHMAIQCAFYDTVRTYLSFSFQFSKLIYLVIYTVNTLIHRITLLETISENCYGPKPLFHLLFNKYFNCKF